MQKIFTLKDTEAGVTNKPFFMTTEREAIDGLRTVVNSEEMKESPIHKHPKDFALYYLGEYNDREMKMELLDSPKKIIEAEKLIQ